MAFESFSFGYAFFFFFFLFFFPFLIHSSYSATPSFFIEIATPLSLSLRTFPPSLHDLDSTKISDDND